MNNITPNYRPFSLLDLSISFPYVEKEKIPTWLLVVVGLIVPAVIIFLVCLIFVPGPMVSKRTSKALIWRRKFWEWNSMSLSSLPSLPSPLFPHPSFLAITLNEPKARRMRESERVKKYLETPY